MLFRSIDFITEQLNRYLDSFPPENKGLAKIENIGGLDEQELKSASNILITLVNINEEATLKNSPNYSKDGFSTVYRNPPVTLNLFVLFASCFENSKQSLMILSRVISFFQGKNIFTNTNSMTNVSGLGEFKMVMDLYSPTFEQVNYLWSTLGGKQRPFVLYKLRVIEIERESTEEIRGVIKEIAIDEQMITG